MTPAEREPLSVPATGAGSKKYRRWFLGVSGILAATLVVVFREVLLPFLLGLVLAYVLSPVVAFGEQLRVRGHSPPRWVVVVSLYLTLIGLLVSLVTFSAPRLASETSRLSKEVPRVVDKVRKDFLPELDRRLREATEPYLARQEQAPALVPGAASATTPAAPMPAIQVLPRAGGGYEVLLPPGGLRVVPEGSRAFRIEAESPRGHARGDLASAITAAVSRSMDNTEQTGVAVLQAAQAFVTRLVRGVFAFLLSIVVSAYLLVTSSRIFEFARSLYRPERRLEFDDLVRRIDRGLSGVVRGQLIICGINGVLSGIGFYILGLKYWTFLTLLAAMMSIIPIFGSILSSIPAVLVALTQDVGLALLVLAWIVGIHQLEANVLNPKIMGDSARVHPVLVVFALLAGEHAFGLVGALLAVPVLSIIQTLFLYLRERFLGVPRNSSIPPPAPESTRPLPDPLSAADASRARG